jgi:hypothetical protein
VRAVVEKSAGGFKTEAGVNSATYCWARVVPNAVESANFFRRLRNGGVLDYTNYTSAAADKITLGPFATTEQADDELTADQMRTACLPPPRSKEGCASEAPLGSSSGLVDEACDMFHLLQAQRRQWAIKAGLDNEPLNDVEMDLLKKNPVKARTYVSNARPENLRKGALKGVSVAAGDAHASFFTAAKASDPTPDVLVQDDYKHHPRSLHHIVGDKLAGVTEASLFFKVGSGFFPLHDEQCGFSFTHHQVSGHSFWFQLDLHQEDEIAKMVSGLACLRAAAGAVKGQPRAVLDETSKDVSTVSWALFLSKSVMPDHKLVKSAKLVVRPMFLAPGEVMTGYGPHFGIGVGAGATVAVATNQMDEQWLLRGFPLMISHMNWIKELYDLGLKPGSRKKLMAQLGVTRELMAKALHQYPPAFLCALLQALRQADNPAHPMHKHQDACSRIEKLDESCANMLSMLHNRLIRKMLKGLYVGVFPGFVLCDCPFVNRATAAAVADHLLHVLTACVCVRALDGRDDAFAAADSGASGGAPGGGQKGSAAGGAAGDRMRPGERARA